MDSTGKCTKPNNFKLQPATTKKMAQHLFSLTFDFPKIQKRNIRKWGCPGPCPCHHYADTLNTWVNGSDGLSLSFNAFPFVTVKGVIEWEAWASGHAGQAKSREVRAEEETGHFWLQFLDHHHMQVSFFLLKISGTGGSKGRRTNVWWRVDSWFPVVWKFKREN